MPGQALVVVTDSIGEVFKKTVADVKAVLTPGTTPVVDLELTFRSVTVDKSGIPIISRKTQENALEVRLATRIVAGE